MRKLLCGMAAMAAMLVIAPQADAQQNTIEQVQATSAAEIMKRMPTNAVYVYDDFQPGIVFFKDGSRARANLNYCFLLDEMHFRNSDGEVQALANCAGTSLVKIGDDAFFYSGNTTSFVQMVIYDDDARLCYRRHTNITDDNYTKGAYGTVNETSSVTRVQSIAYTPGLKDLNNMRDLKYEVVDDYVLLYGDKVVPIRSGKTFEKAFPKLKKEIRAYLQEHQFDPKNADDVVALMEYCISKKK